MLVQQLTKVNHTISYFVEHVNDTMQNYEENVGIFLTTFTLFFFFFVLINV